MHLLGKVILALTVSAASLETAAKDIAGYIEKARLYPGGMLIRAKLDTGAKTSSLHASRLEYFLRDGRRWVRFNITTRKGKAGTVEAPLLRIAKIKRHFGYKQMRPVVRMGVCLGDVYQESEVNLVDRSGFKYKMLIGRRFLDGRFVVDSDIHYVLEPECPPARAGGKTMTQESGGEG